MKGEGTVERDESRGMNGMRADLIIDHIRIRLLLRMEQMIRRLPHGYYTELKNAELDNYQSGAATFKLVDFATALQRLAMIHQAQGEMGPEIEDLDGVFEDLGLNDF